jgi:hypothetical protein
LRIADFGLRIEKQPKKKNYRSTLTNVDHGLKGKRTTMDFGFQVAELPLHPALPLLGPGMGGVNPQSAIRNPKLPLRRWGDD